MTDGVARLAERLAAARRVVVFTGAGVSTECGIPDFRTPGGIWERHEPQTISYAAFMAGGDGRRQYWRLARELYPMIRAAAPSPAHRAIATLHALGHLDCCITQNVDGLHQRAGLPSERVIELHGNALWVRCLSCGAGWPREEVHGWLGDVTEVPECPRCRGVLKPTTVLFGEPMPRAAVEAAEGRARAADLFVVVGSSLAVYPAAYLPRHARQAGASLAVINLTPTPCDRDADLVLRGRAGAILSAVVARLEPAER